MAVVGVAYLTASGDSPLSQRQFRSLDAHRTEAESCTIGLVEQLHIENAVVWIALAQSALNLCLTSIEHVSRIGLKITWVGL